MNIVSSPTTKEILISRGLESFINGSYSVATALFEEVLSNTPDNSEALHHLAGCQIQQKQYESAQETILKAINLDPKNSLAWFRLGQIHYSCKRYESAVDAFGKAIEFKPDFADAWFMGGQALLENGDINDGMLAFKNVISINSSSVIFNEIYARCFMHYKNNIGTIIVLGDIEELILCIPFLLENKDKGIKIKVFTNFRLAENLFKSLSIPIDILSLYSNDREKLELQSKALTMREHYQCPKVLPSHNFNKASPIK